MDLSVMCQLKYSTVRFQTSSSLFISLEGKDNVVEIGKSKSSSKLHFEREGSQGCVLVKPCETCHLPTWCVIAERLAREETFISPFATFFPLMAMEVCWIVFYSRSLSMSLCSQVCGFLSDSLITFRPEQPPYFHDEYYGNILICLLLNI